MSGVLVRPMVAEDAPAVLRIYQEGIDDGSATFEVVAPTWQQFDARRLPDHRYVAVGPNGTLWVSLETAQKVARIKGIAP